MSEKPVYQVYADTSRERLYLAFRGTFEEAQVRAAAAVVWQAAQELEPGFDVVNDLTGFAPVSEDARRALLPLMEALRARGVRRVVRVVDHGLSEIAAMQFNRTSRAAGYTAEIVSSIEEADRRLSAPSSVAA